MTEMLSEGRKPADLHDCQDETTLLPCPFCGDVPVITKHFRDEMYRLLHRCPILGPIIWNWRDARIDLITRWNTRSGQ